ncbi:MAG: 6-carboxytetrahydropterin synthase QueD [Candidatus Omnitrophica bacterium]|nr:6-carboxytetrahydropterin synthase QueD [Candidatus Omnitrophota bacterium]
MFELSVKGDIASAHLLRGYPGKCKDLHGHTWKIEVFLGADQLNELGMVQDFAILKKQFKDFLATLDHKYLNDLEYFQTVNPTAENIAKYIFDQFAPVVAPLALKRVQVWESDMASAIYYG